jgi:hypothetical protein
VPCEYFSFPKKKEEEEAQTLDHMEGMLPEERS